jgi:3-dehydroquinate synthase
MSAASTVLVSTRDGSYPVVVGHDLLGSLTDHLTLPEGVAAALIVTEEGILEAGHVTPVEQCLRRIEIDVHRAIVPTGEPAKQVGVLTELWRAAAQVPLSRRDLVVAVGGGVVGDLAGFAAAAFNRGIGVLQVPTTLLGQVDAAIGGKTGINLPEGKNLVGAFHQPVGVVCDIAALRTLDERILREGFGEIVKYGLIRDPSILELLESGPVEPSDRDLLTELVLRSVRVKAEVVGADVREHGERAHLNLGHTFGHAVETLTAYQTVLHGEAVAIGTVVALHLGVRLGHTEPSLVGRVEDLFTRLGLPIRPPVLDRDEVWTVMARDKKADRDGVRFVVLEDVGRPTVIVPDPSDVNAVLDRLAG